MIKSISKFAVAGLLATGALSTNAATITFEEYPFAAWDPIGSSYVGSHGALFSENAYAINDGDSFPTASHTADTGLYFLDGPGSISFSAPISSFSFWYSNPFGSDAAVTIYGMGGPTTIPLGITPSDTFEQFVDWSFDGGAAMGPGFAVGFSGMGLMDVAFDDFAWSMYDEGGGTDHPVPEPSTVIGGLALGALALRRMFRKS